MSKYEKKTKFSGFATAALIFVIFGIFTLISGGLKGNHMEDGEMVTESDTLSRVGIFLIIAFILFIIDRIVVSIKNR